MAANLLLFPCPFPDSSRSTSAVASYSPKPRLPRTHTSDKHASSLLGAMASLTGRGLTQERDGQGHPCFVYDLLVPMQSGSTSLVEILSL